MLNNKITSTGENLDKKFLRYILYRLGNLLIPESTFKNGLRKLLFKWWPTLPKEFLVNKGDVVVMVGCPYPNTLLRLSKIVGKKGVVVIVEPNQHNINKLVHMSISKKLNNIRLEKKAAFSYQGEVEMWIASDDYFGGGGHRLVMDEIEHDGDYIAFNHYKKKIVVETDTLDNILALYSERIDYIEIAVNGAELEVFKGMQQILPHIKRLFIKGHCRNKKTGEVHSQVLIPKLRYSGFNVLLTVSTKSLAKLVNWGPRTGDVYAWR